MPTCFVIMGFGVKTDYRTSRDLDLDKAYRHIIRSAVQEAGLECVRADEIPHAGTIDVPMHEYLLKADLVVADLSTSNLNAMYELGVRHALKPRTTIIIAEEQFTSPFDVNHIAIRRYRLDGKVLDIEEVDRFRKELVQAIRDIMATDRIDSPVYTYLHNLCPPEERIAQIAKAAMNTQPASQTAMDEGINPTMAVLQEQVAQAKKKNDFITAKALLKTLKEIAPSESKWVQQLALMTYKSEFPDKVTALKEAAVILEELRPMTSNNAETLGLWGAIYKHLFDISGDRDNLDMAIAAYEKGYRLLSDYYNGINWAYLLNVRASLSTVKADAITDFVLAKRTREDLLKIADAKFAELDSIKDVDDRDDRYWVLATKAEALVGLGNDLEAENCLKQANDFADDWMRSSTQKQLTNLRRLLKNSPLQDLSA
jgi:tetratricopeptide (TPR) repeat protein